MAPTLASKGARGPSGASFDVLPDPVWIGNSGASDTTKTDDRPVFRIPFSFSIMFFEMGSGGGSHC